VNLLDFVFNGHASKLRDKFSDVRRKLLKSKHLQKKLFCATRDFLAEKEDAACGNKTAESVIGKILALT